MVPYLCAWISTWSNPVTTDMVLVDAWNRRYVARKTPSMSQMELRAKVGMVMLIGEKWHARTLASLADGTLKLAQKMWTVR